MPTGATRMKCQRQPPAWKLISLLMITAFCSLGLPGCRGYSYTLNERVVYEPPKLFRDYRIDDANLRACVMQAIEDQRITAAAALQDLNCSNAGILELGGIEVFTQLRRLGLDGNKISDITPLLGLRQLELLQLHDNSLRRVGTQLCEGAKKKVALAGNAALDCARLPALAACGVQLLDVPEHCAAAAQ